MKLRFSFLLIIVLGIAILYLVRSMGGMERDSGQGSRLGSSETVDRHLQAGEDFLNKGKISLAMYEFDKAVEESPNVLAAMRVVELLMDLRMYEESIPYIEAAIALPPDRKIVPGIMLNELWDSKLYTTLGDACYHSGQVHRAEKAYREAIRLHKRNGKALNNLGYMLADNNLKLDEALELIKAAVEIEPRNGVYLDSLGWAYYRKGDYDKALEYLVTASEQAPGIAEIRFHLGMVFEADGFADAALIEYKKALKLDPSYALARERIRELRTKPSS